MPTDLDQSVSGSTELVFPDDAPRQKYRLRERSVYDAEEVRDDLGGDMPKYGTWIPVEMVTGTGNEDAYLTAPSSLRSHLVEDDIRVGELFRIESMRKTGTEQSDPYRVNIIYPEREDTQSSESKTTT